MRSSVAKKPSLLRVLALSQCCQRVRDRGRWSFLGTESATVFSGRYVEVFSMIWETTMPKDKGFSLIELLIVVAIILIIAAIAVPSFLRSRIAANESAAAAAIRTVNSAQITYSSAYPSVGFSSTLDALGGTSCNPPNSSSACLIDTVLAGGQRQGYTYTLSNVSGSPSSSYSVVAAPSTANYSGVRNFCSFEDAVIRSSMNTITTCDSTVIPQP
jgi:prepilin-type N-terminal cleavage/methylation domain-containing protein